MIDIPIDKPKSQFSISIDHGLYRSWFIITIPIDIPMVTCVARCLIFGDHGGRP